MRENIDLSISSCYNQVNSNRVFDLKTKFQCITVSNGAYAPFGTFLFSACETQVEIILFDCRVSPAERSRTVMMKIFISDAIVSKGYDGAPAIRFFSGENGGEFAVFQIGKRKYDSREENNHRWVNLKVKAFGDICERIKKMKLKEGSTVSLTGDYDEERWQDKTTGEMRSAPVISLDDIRFSYSGSQKKEQNGSAQETSGQGQPSYLTPGTATKGYPGMDPQVPYGSPAPQQETPVDPMPGNFTGFENFSGAGNPYFPD